MFKDEPRQESEDEQMTKVMAEESQRLNNMFGIGSSYPSEEAELFRRDDPEHAGYCKSINE